MTVAEMLGSIAHRGPDARGAHVEPTIALGSQRLAILDLAGGDQPIYSEDGAICTVYNGEIYNFRQLAAGLRAGGHQLASESDSEVLVHLYEDHGIDFVPRLNGMFAFALWDGARRRLHLARDRFGVKPLYYSWDGRRLAFASEVKALLRGGVIRAELDVEALVELLTFQNILSERSLFRGVSVLPPGAVLTLTRDGALSMDRYWDPLPCPDPGLDRNGLPGQVRELFDQAVARHLASDVEVASYLSGGLDTGAVTAAAVRHLPRLTTFATGFDTGGATGMEAGFDERADAARLARDFGTHHHELLLDAHDMDMVLPRLVWHLEEPRLSFSYPNYLTAGMASRWVKVVLSGVGGDELFGGYPWRYAYASEPDFIERYYGFWTRLLTAPELARCLTGQVREGIELARPRDVFDGVMAAASYLEPLDRILYFESRTYLHGLLIVEDKLSMAHGLESRVPFLDNELVDFVLTVPASVKLRGQRSKDLFRRAMTEVLPPDVVSRKKTGFTPPQAAWFQDQQMPYLRELLLGARARERGVFEPVFVDALLTEHVERRADRRLVLWTLACLEWWHRIFIDEEHPT